MLWCSSRSKGTLLHSANRCQLLVNDRGCWWGKYGFHLMVSPSMELTPLQTSGRWQTKRQLSTEAATARPRNCKLAALLFEDCFLQTTLPPLLIPDHVCYAQSSNVHDKCWYHPVENFFKMLYQVCVWITSNISRDARRGSSGCFRAILFSRSFQMGDLDKTKVVCTLFNAGLVYCRRSSSLKYQAAKQERILSTWRRKGVQSRTG